MSFFEIIGIGFFVLLGFAVCNELVALVVLLLLVIFALPISLIILFIVLMFFLGEESDD